MNKINQILLLLICASFLPNEIVYSQSPEVKFEHFTLEQGFAQTSVFSIFQDSRGFMWFGTTDGLIKYDGYNFKIYKHDINDETSLSYSAVISIYEDKTGLLWIGTEEGGLSKYDTEKDNFTRYMHDSNDPNSLSNNGVIAILEDKSGNLLIGTNGGGLNKLIRGKDEEFPDTFTPIMNNPKGDTDLSHNFIGSIHEEKSGILWIATGNGLIKLIPVENGESASELIQYNHNPDDPESLSSDRIFTIYEDNSGVLWIGTMGGGLNKLVPGKSEKDHPTFIHYKYNPDDPTSLSNNRVSSIYEDNSGNLWVGTLGGGLNKFDIVNEEFTHYKSEPGDPNSLNGDWVYKIYEDNSGILWVGTVPGGINKYDPYKNQFSHYKHNPEDPSSLSENRVFSIYEDQNSDVWIGTFHGGLNKLVPDNAENSAAAFINYKHDSNNPHSLSNNSVFAICEDNLENLWIGTFNGGLNKLIPGEKEKSPATFIHYMHNPDNSASLSNNSIRSIYRDDSGILWIGTQGGLNKLVPGDHEESPISFKRYLHDPDDSTSLSNNIVWTIYEDNQGFLWIGTSGGLNKIVQGENENSPLSFIHYTHDKNDPTSLSNNQIHSICEDNSGELWIGTAAGGLNKFDRENEQFIRFKESDGLPNDGIMGILEDGDGNLWLSTQNGLSKFNPKTEKFRNFVVKDGLQGNEFSTGAHFKNKNGKMFFGGSNGFNSFHPDGIKENLGIPPVFITDFQLFNNSVPIGLDPANNRSILTKNIIESDEIELTYEDYIFSFEFAALDFHIPEKNKYAYFLEGFDKGWQHTDASRRFATYTNLNPGEYTFRVRGSNNDGVWNEEGASIKILITPPWWETWWAYLFYIVGVFSLLYGIRSYELNRVNWKNQFKLDEVKLQEREETDKMKSRFFANISHEFRTPLTLILGPAEKIKPNISGEEIQKQTGLIKRNANRLLSLVNQLLDLSKLEAGKLKLNSSQGNIVSFVKGIVMSFESIAEQKDIVLKVEAGDKDIRLYFDRDKMAKILTNIFSNAFKFTRNGGEITAHIKILEQNLVEIRVRDTGIGISEDELDKLFDRFYQVDSSQTRDHEGSGIGLALTKELVELHHGVISVESQEGKWTEFIIKLPLGSEHLAENEMNNNKIDDVRSLESVKQSSSLEYEVPIVMDLHDDKQIRLTDKDEADENLEEDKEIILIVEDNADVREYIIDTLQNDFQIVKAVNGEEGVRKALTKIPDLIISDIMMPKMDGHELTRILKNDEKTSHIPIILLTAKSEQESKIEGLEKGADDYLIKPFDMRELLIRIKNLIKIRNTLQAKFSGREFMPETEKDKLSNIEEQFMCKVMEIIGSHISEEEFSIEQFADDMAMSRMQLHRKLKALTGKSASLYVRSFRLLKAKKMLEEKIGNVSEIAYSVGFSSPAYFTRCFKEEYGFTPSEISN